MERHFKYSDNEAINHIDYSYIDCGKDGINELALRFNGVYEDMDEKIPVYIIKLVNGKLTLCYYYETWSRSDATLNEYGYYQSTGSSGASNDISDSGVIDKDGNWQSIVTIESEMGINQLSLSDSLKQIPIVAEAKGISDGIQLDTICFDDDLNESNLDETVNKKCFYTFYAFNDNWEPIEDDNLYTNSIYKEIFDEASVSFITPDEVSTMISEKENKLGVTNEIKEGEAVKWQTLEL